MPRKTVIRIIVVLAIVAALLVAISMLKGKPATIAPLAA